MYERLNVLVLSSWYPNRINRTEGNFNEKFSEAAALFNRVDSIHICSDDSMDKKMEIIEFEKDGVYNHYLYFRKKKNENFINRLAKSYKFLHYYFYMFRKYKKVYGLPDIIHLNIVYPVGIIVYLISKLYGIPYVISENWTGYLPANYIKKGLVQSFIRRLIANNASVLMPVTQDLKRAMIDHGYQNHYEIVPNVTNPLLFYPVLNKTSSEIKQILHVSTLKDEHKNIRGILRVMKRLKDIRNDFDLHIVGDGDAKPHMQYAEELGLLNSHVKFFSEMLPNEIADKMRESDFFLLFSNHENLPCVLVESLACGLPVLSTRVGGVAEHLNEEMGIIIEPGDEEALLISCVYMLDNCHKYNKMKLVNYAVENFSYESVGKKLSKIYNTVLSK
jgi:L-malate glycosyltransferase